MTPMTNEAARMNLVTGLAEALRKSIAIERGGHWQCQPSTAGAIASVPVDSSGHLVMSVRLRGTVHGEVKLVLSEQDASVLLADRDGVLQEDLRNVWLTLMEGMVKCLPKRAADAGTFAFSVESCSLVESASEGMLIGHMELREAEGTNATLQVLADEELVSSLKIGEWGGPESRRRSGKQSARGSQLGRVIDVPLAVTLRFGQRQMRLREVLELNTGSLVELDRQVEEPVDLMLGERVIARGDVVIVDGNYGLRVTEIVERNPMSAL
jgi:flagellar motor switch protein FliN